MNDLGRLVLSSHAALFGRRPRRQIGIPSLRGSYLGLLSALFAVCFSLAAFVVAVDPYGLYPWGIPIKFQRSAYDTTAIPWIVTALTKSDYDTFYIGASTSVGFRAEDMQEILPGTRKAFNLSTLGPSVKDIQTIMDLVSNAPKLHRVVLQLEATFMQPLDARDDRFVHMPAAFDTNDRTKSLRAIDGRSIRLAWRMLIGHEYYVKEWDARGRTQFMDWAIAHYKTPGYISHLRSVIDDDQNRLNPHRSSAPRVFPCYAYPALLLLENFAQRLGSRNVELDVVFPPYSRALYFEWVARGSDFHWQGIDDIETLLDYIMAMRRCVTTVLDAKPGAKVFQFDSDDRIVGDYGNYGDPAHINSEGIDREILRAIASDTHRVTKSGFDDYEREFRADVSRYHLTYTASK